MAIPAWYHSVFRSYRRDSQLAGVLMLVAAAVLPHPPLLVPAVGSGAASELDDVRAACMDALRSVLTPAPDRVVVVGTGADDRSFELPVWGRLDGYGLLDEVSWPPSKQSAGYCADLGGLPLSLTMAAWLMGQLDFPANIQFRSVRPTMSVAEAEGSSAVIASSVEKVSLVVMGDGSSTLTEKSPGYVVPGAKEWNSAVAKALATADRDALLALTAQDAAEFGAAGLVPWWVLAGAARDGPWHGELLVDVAPYGVGYLVATWRRRL